jgi:hypothetical protein
MDDSQIRDLVSYVVEYIDTKYPENLETIIHLIG